MKRARSPRNCRGGDGARPESSRSSSARAATRRRLSSNRLLTLFFESWPRGGAKLQRSLSLAVALLSPLYRLALRFIDSRSAVCMCASLSITTVPAAASVLSLDYELAASRRFAGPPAFRADMHARAASALAFLFSRIGRYRGLSRRSRRD